MKVILSRNVNEAYVVGLRSLDAYGDIQDSRVGQTKVHPYPVSTVYAYPCERVLFNEKRDANPFFHLMEGLWMLAGCNDVEWISRYNNTFSQFSDNGITFNAAYGYRWRKHFNRDQLDELVKMLKDEPNTRRAVISMWDPYADFNQSGKDFPCNLNIAFRIRKDKLTMTVFNRSNDIIWGAYGANAVHMSMLQEYIAARVGIEIDRYTQVSNDYHAYVEVLDRVGSPNPHPMDPYEMQEVKPYPLVDDPAIWNYNLDCFMHDTALFHKWCGYASPTDFKFDMKTFSLTPFFSDIAVPMARAWGVYKKKDYKAAITIITENMPDKCDWKVACRAWLLRRIERNATRNAEKGRGRQKVAHDN